MNIIVHQSLKALIKLKHRQEADVMFSQDEYFEAYQLTKTLLAHIRKQYVENRKWTAEMEEVWDEIMYWMPMEYIHKYSYEFGLFK